MTPLRRQMTNRVLSATVRRTTLGRTRRVPVPAPMRKISVTLSRCLLADNLLLT